MAARPVRPAEELPPYALSPADLCRHLHASLSGLTAGEAAARLAAIGPNEVRRSAGPSVWALLLRQFRSLLTIILLVATALSAAMGHGVEALAITAVVLFSVVLGFIQEYRAERALEALQQMAVPAATVVRDGRQVEVQARSVVPGDLLVLRAGHRVVADARLVEAVDLATEEAALTGESIPVAKHTDTLAEAPLVPADQLNMAFAGTLVSRGRGLALVVATGMETEFGRIAHLLETVQSPPTPLQAYLERLGRVLARMALVVVAMVVAIGLSRGQPLIEMLVFGVALAVAVVPEVLPAVVTISLAVGVQRLVRRRALMRRLPAVETLGSTSVICSDKTGTLTRNEMTVRQMLVAGELVAVSGAGYAPIGECRWNGRLAGWSGPPDDPLRGPLERLLSAAALSSDARLEQDPASGDWSIQGDPTEAAMVVAAAKAGLSQAGLMSRFPRVGEIPFAADRMRMTTVHATPLGIVAHAKGAPEVILPDCARQMLLTGDAVLGESARAAVLAAGQLMASTGHRVLAVASGAGPTLEAAEGDLTLLGLVGIMDPPRDEARAAVQRCQEAGVRVVMITGDHPLTAQAVARELGLLGQGRIMTGPELALLSDRQLQADIRNVEVFARMSPTHKLRIVSALQGVGEVVAMTGDGVNDAPALKQADIGVAMGAGGTDVAREAAALTLTDDNFATIVAAVEEGRGIIGNIRKYLMFLLSSNVGEIGLITIAAMAGLPMPLTAVQILYVNLATDGLPALALAMDPPEADLMRRRPRPRGAGIFTRPMILLMLVGGVWSALVNLAVFVWALRSGRDMVDAMTLTFASLVLIQLVKAFNFRSDHRPVYERPLANRWLDLAVAWELGLLVLVVQWSVLQRPFGTAGLGVKDWLLVAGVALTVAPILEAMKWAGRRGWLGAYD